MTRRIALCLMAIGWFVGFTIAAIPVIWNKWEDAVECEFDQIFYPWYMVRIHRATGKMQDSVFQFYSSTLGWRHHTSLLVGMALHALRVLPNLARSLKTSQAITDDRATGRNIRLEICSSEL